MKDKIIRTTSRFKSWWLRQSTRRKVFYIVIIVIVVFFVVKGKGATPGTTVETVKRQTLVQSVSASGTVVSSTDLSLGFEQSKIVNSVRVVVGQKVTKGTILATISNGSEWASVASARGMLLAAQARYSKVLDGSSNEEIALAKVTLNNAQTDLENTTKVQNGLVENTRRTLNSGGLVAESSTTQSATAPLVSGTYTGNEGQYNLTLNVTGGDTSYVTYSGLESGTVKASTTSPQTFGSKGLSLVFPSGTVFAQGGTWIIKIPNTTSSTYVANANSYISAQNTRDQSIASSQAKVDQATAELNLKRATARQPDIDVALADVVTAQAGLDQANATLEKTILRAPADGTITKVNVKVGELAEANKEAVGLQDISNLYLEASINESNIKSVAVGQSVSVTFDAFGDENYYATLSSIDPAATVTSNVVNYKVKALLSDAKDIRPGMTANMTIVTNQVNQALVLPGRTVTTKDGHSTVMLITDQRNNKTLEKEVTLGLKGDGDKVEIKSGLSEGDKVLWVPPVTK